jgi:hypothetical protein
LNFYKYHNVRVKVYGNPESLKNPAYDGISNLINQTEKITKENSTHTLFIGIGGEPWVGWDAVLATTNYYKTYGNFPSDKQDLIKYMYGEYLPPANFVIFSGKPGGLGALPALISGKNTQIFYLPAPGVLSLNQTTYRKILHNQIYVKKGGYDISKEQLDELRTEYKSIIDTVVGLGQNVGSVWMPFVPKDQPSDHEK